MEEASEPVSMNDIDEESPDDPARPEPEDEFDRLAHIIESVLFAAATPVSLRRLVEILDGPTAKEVQAALARLAQHYAPGQRGIQLREVAGGYQLRTARENAEWVRAVFRDKPARLGRAALETLAIVAYKQPATRAEIEAIRGVDVDGVLSTLLGRRLIKISGRKEAVGRPLLYGTTPEFLEAFGLKDLHELPSLKELGPAPDAEDTVTPSETGQPENIISATAESSEAEQTAPENEQPLAKPPAEGPEAAAGAVGASAEDTEQRRDRVEAQGGGVDSSGAGTGERAGGDAAGDEGRAEDGSDHG